MPELVVNSNYIPSLFEKMFEGYNIRMFYFKDELRLVGKDVANALGYKDTADAIKTHCDDRVNISTLLKHFQTEVGDAPTFNEIKDLEELGLHPQTVVITENDLYALILRSKKREEAKKFQKWVYSVIKEIRETGGYSLTNSNNLNIATINKLAEAISELTCNYKKLSDDINKNHNILEDKIETSNKEVFNYIDDKFNEKINNLIAYKNIGNRNITYSELVMFINKEYAPPGQATDIARIKDFLVSVGMIKKNGNPFDKYIKNGCIELNADPFAVKPSEVVFTKDGVAFVIQMLVEKGWIKI